MSKIIYRFEYGGGSNYIKYWVIQKRFLWIFWLQTEGIISKNVNTFRNLDEAKQWIEELKKRKQKK